MQRVTYAPGAVEDVLGAVTYYEQQHAGLGDRFLDELDRAIGDIRRHPLAWPVIDEPYRRHQLRRFPFGVIYRLGDQTIHVLAVMHMHLPPGYWHDRT